MLFSLLICTPPFFYDGLFRAQDVSGRLSCRGCGTFHHVLCRLQLGPEARSCAGGSVARLAVMPYSHGRLALSGQLCFCEVSGHPCPLPGSAHRFTLVSFPLTRGDAVARSPFPSCAVCLPGPARQGKRSRRAAPFIYHFRVVAADEVAVLNVFEPTDLNVFVNFALLILSAKAGSCFGRRISDVAPGGLRSSTVCGRQEARACLRRASGFRRAPAFLRWEQQLLLPCGLRGDWLQDPYCL